MNDRLLAILAERPDFHVTDDEKKALDFFVEYLDRGSLFMSGYEPGLDPVFLFTNDAQIYRFLLSEILLYVMQMKRGEAMDWERVPFEYKSKVLG
ncbi:MAG: hypothetical protein Q8922_02840 [Bacteroidota bacterium]|nr:hypothetical protein [Bacteroidota bacterium]MDP4232902.1 hypothetical protein [Bacteroidota bacterium]MDP4241946.1 hypothetical protein [Bacteroidota bacterium]MDP4286849.1 hypothetical protein [Bacteroidota bacterium]